jgi:hypothetical protein
MTIPSQARWSSAGGSSAEPAGSRRSSSLRSAPGRPSACFLGAPDKSRTCDLGFRKALLYPTELRGRVVLDIDRAASPVRGGAQPSNVLGIRQHRSNGRERGRSFDARGRIFEPKLGSAVRGALARSARGGGGRFETDGRSGAARRGAPRRAACGLLRRDESPLRHTAGRSRRGAFVNRFFSRGGGRATWCGGRVTQVRGGARWCVVGEGASEGGRRGVKLRGVLASPLLDARHAGSWIHPVRTE